MFTKHHKLPYCNINLVMRSFADCTITATNDDILYIVDAIPILKISCNQTFVKLEIPARLIKLNEGEKLCLYKSTSDPILELTENFNYDYPIGEIMVAPIESSMADKDLLAPIEDSIAANKSLLDANKDLLDANKSLLDANKDLLANYNLIICKSICDTVLYSNGKQKILTILGLNPYLELKIECVHDFDLTTIKHGNEMHLVIN
jgi:hypothetical protein